MSDRGETAGLLLAAGRGTRMGRPKALVTTDGISWLDRSARVLVDAGCAPVVVVLGAAAEQAERIVPPGVTTVVAPDFADGVSASLRAGLAALAGSTATAALVHLVDLPDVTAAVARRVLASRDGPTRLARAAYGGVPGHPVLIGRAHWEPLLERLAGDTGARSYLADAGAALVECADLATGQDVDSM